MNDHLQVGWNGEEPLQCSVKTISCSKLEITTLSIYTTSVSDEKALPLNNRLTFSAFTELATSAAKPRLYIRET